MAMATMDVSIIMERPWQNLMRDIRRVNPVEVDDSIPAPPPFPETRELCLVCDRPFNWLCKKVVADSCSHHTFCQWCWKDWLVVKLREGAMYVKCLAQQCDLSHTDIQTYLRDKVLLEKLEENLLFHAITQSGDSIACPKCHSVGFYLEKSHCSTAECNNCSHSFCVRCNQPKHSGTCESAMQGLSAEDIHRLQSELASGTWKSQNTKQCPNCQTYILKTEGCSHITCSRCQYQWCWICLKKYSGRHVPHGSIKCHCL